MKLKRRHKVSRMHGRGTHGWGARKKHMGSGHRGGVGMAGTGKKAGQKITYLLKYVPGYLGRRKGFVSIPQKKQNKLKVINLDEINKKLEKFRQDGI